MSKKIIGYTVGTTIPKPSFAQNDPKKGDYIKDKEILDAKYVNIDAQDLTNAQKAQVRQNIDAVSQQQVDEISDTVAYIGETDNETVTDAETETVTNAVLYTAQTLTDNQKRRARLNIDAASEEDVNEALADKADRTEIPTTTSALKNDSGFLTGIPDEYITETELNQNLDEYAKKSEIPAVPVQSVNGKVGAVQLNASDVNARPNTWMPTAEEVGALPKDTKIPAKMSDLDNDEGFITEIPDEYITETELNSKGYLTQHQDLSSYAKKTEVTAVTEELNKLDEKTYVLQDGETIADAPAEAEVVYDPNGDDMPVDLGVFAQKTGWTANKYLGTDANGNMIEKDAPAGGITEETDPTVPSWAKQANKPTYTASEVGALPASTKIPAKTSDLTNDSGYITGYTETDPTVPAWAKESTKPAYTKSEIGLGNVDNVKQYSANNPPPYPITSVNGKTGDVSLTASDVGARPSTWTPTASEVGAQPAGNYALKSEIPSVPVQSVNGKTGTVNLSAEDVGAATVGQVEQISQTIAEQQTAINGKLPKNLGADNVGKILVVGSDGNLTLTDMPEGGVSGDVVGVLDESRNILLSGDIAEGTYPLKWLMTDGTYADAGTLTVTLTPELEAIINWVTNSINADGTPFVGANGEKGYKTNTRLSVSSGAESTSSASGIETTGFIPVKVGDTMYIKGVTVSASATNQAIVFYNSNFEYTKTGGGAQGGTYIGGILGDVNGELRSLVLTDANLKNNNFNQDVAYIRICAGEINENSIITINQPIV